jgi:heme/copper-type cytochrome/quinol oxidase subunit 2
MVLVVKTVPWLLVDQYSRKKRVLAMPLSGRSLALTQTQNPKPPFQTWRTVVEIAMMMAIIIIVMVMVTIVVKEMARTAAACKRTTEEKASCCRRARTRAYWCARAALPVPPQLALTRRRGRRSSS